MAVASSHLVPPSREFLAFLQSIATRYSYERTDDDHPVVVGGSKARSSGLEGGVE